MPEPGSIGYRNSILPTKLSQRASLSLSLPTPRICSQNATEALIKNILPSLIQFLPTIASGFTSIVISLKWVSQFKPEVKHPGFRNTQSLTWNPSLTTDYMRDFGQFVEHLNLGNLISMIDKP